jgi:hypothetical protein
MRASAWSLQVLNSSTRDTKWNAAKRSAALRHTLHSSIRSNAQYLDAKTTTAAAPAHLPWDVQARGAGEGVREGERRRRTSPSRSITSLKVPFRAFSAHHRCSQGSRQVRRKQRKGRTSRSGTPAGDAARQIHVS